MLTRLLVPTSRQALGFLGFSCGSWCEVWRWAGSQIILDSQSSEGKVRTLWGKNILWYFIDKKWLFAGSHSLVVGTRGGLAGPLCWEWGWEEGVFLWAVRSGMGRMEPPNKQAKVLFKRRCRSDLTHFGDIHPPSSL